MTALVVLDRSCSLSHAVNGSTQWEIVVDAINTMTKDKDYVGRIRFVLTLFPVMGDGKGCVQTDIANKTFGCVLDRGEP